MTPETARRLDEPGPGETSPTFKVNPTQTLDVGAIRRRHAGLAPEISAAAIQTLPAFLQAVVIVKITEE